MIHMYRFFIKNFICEVVMADVEAATDSYTLDCGFSLYIFIIQLNDQSINQLFHQSFYQSIN